MNTVFLTGGIAAVFLVLAHLRNVANAGTAGNSGPVAPTYAQQPLPDFGADGSGASFQASPFDALGMLQQLQSAYPQPILNLTPNLSVVDNPPTSTNAGTGANIGSGSTVSGFFQTVSQALGSFRAARPVSSPGIAQSAPAGNGMFTRPATMSGSIARPAVPAGQATFGPVPAAPTTSTGFITRNFKPTPGLKRPTVGGL